MEQAHCQRRQLVMQGSEVITIAAGEAPVICNSVSELQLFNLGYAINFLRTGIPEVQLVVENSDTYAKRKQLEQLKTFFEAVKLEGENFSITSNEAVKGVVVFLIKRRVQS
ncbi:MAG: hypothetical protein HY462_01555 [Parcubacteria group bacterium]|nr:hypothetical protein [Parcubacteria group bacterium]